MPTIKVLGNIGDNSTRKRTTCHCWVLREQASIAGHNEKEMVTVTVSTRVLWKESAHRFQYFAESFDGGKGDFGMRHSFLYSVGTHFRIFVRKFLVNFRTVCASAQKLARPLHGVTFWVNYSNKRCIIGAALSRGRRSSMFLISNAALIRGRRSLMFLISMRPLFEGGAH